MFMETEKLAMLSYPFEKMGYTDKAATNIDQVVSGRMFSVNKIMCYEL